MQRLGHDSMRAALIHQHLPADADKRLTDGLTTQVAAHLRSDVRTLNARSLREGDSE